MSQTNDRISELPQDVKQKVLSCLTSREAARTRFVSKSWENTWLTLPRLYLPCFYLGSSIDHVWRDINDILTKRSKCADKLLQKLALCIPHLPLDRSYDSTSRLLNKWVDLIVNDFRVERFEFRFYCDENPDAQIINNLYVFPTSILTSEKQRISDFKLYQCALNSSLTVTWSTLLSLCLSRVRFDQKVLDSLTCNCPLIEELEIDECVGDFNTIKASHLKRLVSFSINAFSPIKGIEINAPNLREFSFKCTIRKVEDEDEDEDEGCCIIDNLSLSKGLTRLSIVNDKFLSDDEWLNRNLGQFTKLEYLNLDNCDGVKHLKLTSVDYLQSIDIRTCYNLEDVTIDDAPQLWYLRYSGKQTPSFKLINTPSLESVLLSMFNIREWYEDDEPAIYERLIHFLSGFGHLQKLELEIVPIPDDVRKIQNPPLVGVKTLIVTVFDTDGLYRVKEGARPDYKSLVETLLWVAPRLDSLSIRWTQEDYDASGLTITKFVDEHKIIQFKYEEDEDMADKCDNCKHLPVRCWRHAQVTIKNIQDRHDEHESVLAAIFNINDQVTIEDKVTKLRETRRN